MYSFVWKIAAWLGTAILSIAVALIIELGLIGYSTLIGALMWFKGATGVDIPLILPYLEMANYWFPLDHCFAAITALVSFWTIYAAVKITIKLIPTIG